MAGSSDRSTKGQLAAWAQAGRAALETRARVALTRIGARFSGEALRRMDAAFNYLSIGRWALTSGFEPIRRLPQRTDVFDLALAELRHRRVLYLEFGVWRGKSLRYWSRNLQHPGAMLHGFDTFEGLPEAWSDHGKGDLSTGGTVPPSSDPRIKYFKGMFEETLPRYQVPEHDTLFVNVDCDLYSSTTTVLRFAEPLLRPGSFVYFDEFSDRHHERRAFDEFRERTGLRFSLVGATSDLVHVLFRREDAAR